MTTSGVPPEGRSEARAGRKRRLDAGTRAGIFSIVIGLLTAGLNGPYLLELATDNIYSQETLWGELLFCLYPAVPVGALIAVLGLVSARKERSTRGFRLSMAGLILHSVLLLVSVWTLFAAW